MMSNGTTGKATLVSATVEPFLPTPPCTKMVIRFCIHIHVIAAATTSNNVVFKAMVIPSIGTLNTRVKSVKVQIKIQKKASEIESIN